MEIQNGKVIHMIEYTKDDMRELARLSPDGTVTKEFLPDMDYDPQQLYDFFVKHKQHQAIKYLFEEKLDDLLLVVNDPLLQGISSFRWQIGK